MNIFAIFSLILGIFFILLASYFYKLFYHEKSNCPKLHYISIFMLLLLGIIYILGAITGHIGLAILLALTLLLFFVLYHKRKYSSSEFYIKEEYPERYAKINLPVSIWAKIGMIIGFLLLVMFAIVNF